MIIIEFQNIIENNISNELFNKLKEVQSQSGSLKIVREHVNITMNIISCLSNGNIWWWTIKVEANVYEISRKEIKNQIEEMSNQEAYFLQKIKAFMMRKKTSELLDYKLPIFIHIVFDFCFSFLRSWLSNMHLKLL